MMSDKKVFFNLYTSEAGMYVCIDTPWPWYPLAYYRRLYFDDHYFYAYHFFRYLFPNYKLINILKYNLNLII